MGIALKIKTTDQIKMAELIQNKKSLTIVFSFTFFSLKIYHDIEIKIKKTGRLIMEINSNFSTFWICDL
ncbi:hypothetical protein [Chryseobacterium sp. GVT01B]|uniref:hypothetical protein n=1 Tax=Chryseobacterium sp. GVT01B TaxID=2862675 RepID=UPI001CBB2E86|nr:hypothetical protein [Chryseobacterium sp. GVT01B]